MFNKKSLFLIPIFTIILILGFASRTSAAPDIKRLAGGNRYETAAIIAKEGWSQSDYAVLAYGENYPDALAAAPLARKFDAPILLTTKDSLIEQTKQVLQDLKIKNVFIVGGTGVISVNVETQLTNMGVKVTRLSGADRYETAVKIAEQLGDVEQIAVATGSDFSDALSIASISANKNMPILLTSKDELSNSVKNYINTHRISKTYVMGNLDTISKNVENFFDNTERIFGLDKYDKNIAILMEFYFDLKPDTIYIATGNDFADALTGTALAAKKSSPIILVDSTISIGGESYIYSMLKSIKQVTLLGGEGVITNSSMDDLKFKINNALEKVGQYNYYTGDSSNEVVYSGVMENNKSNGRGIVIENDRIRYYGEIINGSASGVGTKLLSNGSKYTGKWENGFPNGEGTEFYFSGSTYEGTWKNGMKDGKGTYKDASGFKYTGEWLKDSMFGYGIETWPNGDKYEGNYENNKINGQGTYTCVDGRKYVGLWKNDLRFGNGIETWPNGDKYEGNWENDKMSGQGTYTWADGEKYIGEFKDDKRNGFGTTFYVNSNILKYEGNWLDDEKNGEGTTYFRDGKQSTDMWEHGKPLYNIK